MKDAHLKGVNECLKELNSSKDGLSEEEANNRLNEFGLNELPKGKKVTFFTVFFSQFKNPMVYILFIAMVLSLIVSEYTDALFIFIVVVSDALLGAYEEYRSNKASENLKSIVKMNATVLRDGIQKDIDSSLLVKGDIVILESGDRVPADLRIISSSNLSIDESILTGESFSREKNSTTLKKDVVINDRSNMAFLGSSVMRGRAKALVVATGVDTQIGKIASEVLNGDESMSPLEIRMTKFSKQLGMITLFLALLVSFILYYKNYTTKEIFFLVVALSISAIPEGLPVIITLASSISSNKMAKKNVLVKKLDAVEALGSATLIATDKTGTLTLNEQTVKKIILPNNEEFNVTGIGYNDKGVIKGKNLDNLELLIKEGVLNNEATLKKVNKEWISLGDSMDIALLALGYKYKINIENTKSNLISNIPYESENGYCACFYKEEDYKVAIKGSLEKVLNYCKYELRNGRKYKIDKDKIRKQNEELTKDGYRVLAFASRKLDNFKVKEKYGEEYFNDMVFLGLVAFVDPIRNDAKEAVNKCSEAGIKVVMITGDHPLTALSVGKEIGIANSIKDVITGEEIDKLILKGYDELDIAIKDKKVFSRVTPVQKLQIVSSFQRMGEFIAVSGDGVNDTPALKRANVSIAMGSGTDVAKDTASIILMDDKFSSIVEGVEEGRGAYDNIRKVIYMLLSCGVCEILFYLLAILFDLDIPLTALQLLYLNLVTDGIQDVALSFEKTESDVMKRKPRNPSEGLFDKLLIKEIILSGLTMGLIVFALWKYMISSLNMDVHLARNYILTLMVFMQNIHCFNARSETHSIFTKSIKDNYYIAFGVISVILLQIVIVESETLSNILDLARIPFRGMIAMLLLTIPLVIVSEIFKIFQRKKCTKIGAKRFTK